MAEHAGLVLNIAGAATIAAGIIVTKKGAARVGGTYLAGETLEENLLI